MINNNICCLYTDITAEKKASDYQQYLLSIYWYYCWEKSQWLTTISAVHILILLLRKKPVIINNICCLYTDITAEKKASDYQQYLLSIYWQFLLMFTCMRLFLLLLLYGVLWTLHCILMSHHFFVLSCSHHFATISYCLICIYQLLNPFVFIE